jgi:hypothetical protein
MANSSLSAVSLSAKKAESDASSRVPWTDQSNFKFLSQAHDILQTNVSRRDSPRGRFVSEAPFHFIISRTIPSTNSEAPEQCLRLPRSLDLGDGYIDPSRGKRFAHPSITFYLRAVVTVFTAGHEDPKSVETFLPVIIAPYTEELPPTETGDFPWSSRSKNWKHCGDHYWAGC